MRNEKKKSANNKEIEFLSTVRERASKDRAYKQSVRLLLNLG